MDRNSRIYNFGPDGRDACWAALSNSWSRCQYQQDLNTMKAPCDCTSSSDVEAKSKDTSTSFSSRSVNSCRSAKKTSVLKTSLSSRSKPIPLSSPRTPKSKPCRQLDTHQQLVSANNRLSSSMEVINQVISEPPSTNDQCNCSQSGYSEMSVVNSIMSNNNNNNDNEKNTQKLGAMETIDVVNQKQQQLMCAADSGSSVGITERATVYAEKPIIVLQNECGDHILSVSRPSTPSTTEQPIESAHQIEGENVSSVSSQLTLSTANKQPFESTQQIKDENVSSVSSQLTLSTANKQPFESTQQIEDENVSSVSSQLTLSTANKQPFESTQQIEGENVSSVSSLLILSTANKQPFQSTQQIEGENVSSVSCPLTPSTTVEQQIEGDNVSSMSNPLYSSITIEQQIESVQKIERENVSSVSSLLILSTANKQSFESTQQIECENVSSISSQLVLSTTVEQQIEGDNVSSMSNPLYSSITIEQQIESVQKIEVENVSSKFCSLTMSTAVEQQVKSEQQMESDPILSMSSLPSPSMAAKNSMMTEVVGINDTENPTFHKVVTPSPQSQPLHKDDDEYPVQSNTEIMELSEKSTLSQYEMKIREIDNNIISYSKSILCTVLVVVVLRVLF